MLVLAILHVAWSDIAPGQLPSGELHTRTSRLSNFEFALWNNGKLFGDKQPGSPYFGFTEAVAYWPRGSFHLYPRGNFGGIAFLAKKGAKYLVSDNALTSRPVQERGPFRQMVPGTIGDPGAGYDSVFGGAGWRYADSPDYVVYSSLDFDARGEDVSGANFNDWPLRWQNDRIAYVRDPSARRFDAPAFISDEDLFCVFKDTETRADWWYGGGRSEPIGVEIRNSVYTWGSGGPQDIVVFRYEFVNKSRLFLDSCYFAVDPDLTIAPPYRGREFETRLRRFGGNPARDLAFMEPVDTSQWSIWTATPRPPVLGYSFVSSAVGYQGGPVGIARAGCVQSMIAFRRAGPDSVGFLLDHGNDSIAYYCISELPPPISWWVDECEHFPQGPVLVSGSFPMGVDSTVTFSVAMIFSDSVGQLLLLDDLVKRMHANGYQRPSAPPAPMLVATGLNRAVKLTWDRRAEETPDVIVPDSLGRPFTGYRLLRSVTERGPYTEVARWSVDSLIVHEYIDRGEGIGGLKNNVRYYYQLLAFDEGAPRIKLELMESKPEEGVNWVSAIPGASASDLTTSSGSGALVSGTLGNVSTPQLIPTDNTNFANLFSGKSVELNVTAATDGIRYTLPVTVRDTISGREQFAVLDPGLFVGGTPAMAGVKEGVLHIPDVFGLGGARIDLPYRFEQTDDTLALAEPVIESPTGADVPVLVRDSMHTTGIQTLTPYIESGRELVIEFLPGGIDTISYIFGFILPYRNIRITDGATGEELEPGVDWTVRLYITRAQGGPQGSSVRNRYYLSGLAPNGFELHAGHLLTINNSVVVFDYPDRGRGSGKPAPTFPWGSGHRVGTRDFQVGDRVRIGWDGGVRGLFPRDAIVTLTGPTPGQAEVTENMLDKVRIVPNPYMIRHEAQRGAPRVYFNYLPEECTITIYTVALDRIATLQHRGGSREEWNLMTERGQLVASQLLFASIESPNGKRVTKKFAVILGR
jgi:hypothetical protein